MSVDAEEISAMLEVDNVSAGYGRQQVLHAVSLSVADGQMVAVLGPNGHGKTTLLRCISGMVRAVSGSIRLDGLDMLGRRIDEIVERGVVHIPQGDMIFPQMSVIENLLMGAYLENSRATVEQRLDHVYELLPRLRERHRQIATTLSGGERRMLAIGRGLMSGGRMLLVDEPSLGLAPLVIEQIYQVLSSLKKEGRSILLVEENASRVADEAEMVYLLDDGKIVWQGQSQQLWEHAELIETYMGG
jgi:branched-chain amino acid transport system ATP-binding protein